MPRETFRFGSKSWVTTRKAEKARQAAGLGQFLVAHDIPLGKAREVAAHELGHALGRDGPGHICGRLERRTRHIFGATLTEISGVCAYDHLGPSTCEDNIASIEGALKRSPRRLQGKDRRDYRRARVRKLLGLK